MKVGVVGAGVMGAGIAQVCAMAEYETVLFDIQAESLEKAKNSIAKNLNKAVGLGKLEASRLDSVLKTIKYTSDIKDVKVDLVIEAIVERLDIKLNVFKELADINGENCIYASNTSSIPLTKIASKIPYPKQLVGIHFFNPAYIMKLVEVIKAEQTDESVLNKAVDFVNSLNKKCIVAKDAPGFIVNRVARHFYIEGLKVLEEGVADHQVIDELIQSSGFKMGPFRLMDLIGVETNLSVTESMYELFNYDQKFRPNRIQQKKVQAGYFGRKTSKGFYNYD
ncbi:MAG: 3-hydroxybutyryl-CoA dehydrogenase [Bacteroidia bacterium]